MVKLGELLGLGNNPLYQAFSSNRGAISGAFGGMAANPMNPWAGFAHGGQVGGQLDLQSAEAQRQEQEQATAKNSTLEWLRSRGYDDLVAGVEGGGLDMGTAWGEALRRGQPQTAEMTADMRNWNYAQQNPQFAKFLGIGNGPELTDTQRNLMFRAEQAGLQPGTPEYEQFMLSGGAGGTSLNVDPTTGTVSFTQGYSAKPLTEQQSKDTVYAVRAEGALPIIDQYGTALTNPLERAVEGDPTGLARGMQSPEFQQAQQAGKEFLQAVLRKDTGAAITPQETAEYGTVYLPVPGDSPTILEQKRISRARALEAMKAGMPPQAILAQEQALQRTGGSGGQPTAVNPQTGETVVWNGQAWVPA